MKKFINLIKKKWLVNTSKTILLVVIIIAVFLGINYGVKKMDLTPIDITENKLYSLTDETKNSIKDISKEIHIYFFGYDEKDNSFQLAKQYSKENENIKVKKVDASTDADLYKKYEVDESVQGVVVECGDKNKILTSNDFYTYDYSTYNQIDKTEETLTSTILNIITDEKAQVYFLTGHSEPITKYSIFQTFLYNDLNEVNNLDLLASDFPKTCDCLILTTPTSDYGEIETNKIKNYINNGGNILCLMDSFSKDFVNVQSILDLYGVTISEGTIKDTDSSKVIANDERFIIPDASYHDITQYIITDGGLLFVEPSKLNINEEKLDELNVESSPLVKSSETSYISTTNEKGAFTLGAELKKSIREEDSKTSKLIIYTSSKFAQDSISLNQQSMSPFTAYSNKDLLLNSVAYLSNKDSSITIRKNTDSVTYTATAKQNNIILAIIFIIPILIIIFGILVGILRRRKK